MVILDTDHVSLLERGRTPTSQVLIDRLELMPADEVRTTIISFEEQIRGWFAFLAAARNLQKELVAYERLCEILRIYNDLKVLTFDGNSAAEFQRLRKLKLRLGTMDLKIAAIALASDATLLSRNISDFGRIPGLKLEDWTQPQGSP
jgi:tRNA(fMet)-specific endonuclease VapC